MIEYYEGMEVIDRSEVGDKLTKFCKSIVNIFADENAKFGIQEVKRKTSFATASRQFLKQLFEEEPVVDFLCYLSRAPVFSNEFQSCFLPMKQLLKVGDLESSSENPVITKENLLEFLVNDNSSSGAHALDALACCKRLKYFSNTGMGQIVRDVILLVKLLMSTDEDAELISVRTQDMVTGLTSSSSNVKFLSDDETPTMRDDNSPRKWDSIAVLEQHAEILFRDHSSGLASVVFKDYVGAMCKLSGAVEAVESKMIDENEALCKMIDGKKDIADCFEGELKSISTLLKPTTQLAKHLGINIEGNAVTLDGTAKMTSADWEKNAKDLNNNLKICTKPEVMNSKDLKSILRQRLSSRIHFFESEALKTYKKNLTDLESIDPHAVYPTSIYRRCDGLTLASSDAQTIEAVMSTELTTTIKITRDVLNPRKNTILASVYESIGRVVALVDDKVDYYGYSDQLEKYFDYYGITFVKLVYGGNEVDKDIKNVENILIDLKANGVSRNEPLLIVGGGVLADISGFAAALYHRNTPYVMLSTSIVSGIDAGPSPRTCCDGFGYKNLYGAYHPPVLTITDRGFWKTLHPGWVRHGIAEIIKMAVVKDLSAFELLEKAGSLLVETKFGTDMSNHTTPEQLRGMTNEEFQDVCDAIIGKAMEGYVRSEYGNLWETHQCRPHAYGHTWSPGYELPAGMLHGHAVATCMGYGAYIAWKHTGFITQEECDRILDLISNMELALYHPIMDNVEVTYSAQEKMVQKRGGNLCAPVPKGKIGKCGYINDIDRETLIETMGDYKKYVQEVRKMPRNGEGIDMHCHDVGLEDPAITAKAAMKKEGVTDMTGVGGNRRRTQRVRSEKNAAEKTAPAPAAAEQDPAFDYNTWIKEKQESRNKEWKMNVEFQLALDTEHPPHDRFKCPFTKNPHVQLFSSDVVEEYAIKNTSVQSKNVQNAARITDEEKLFAPCMVGSLESQFLKMQAMMLGAKRVLDVGTFTGMSALAFAEGCLMGDGMKKVICEKYMEKLYSPSMNNNGAGSPLVFTKNENGTLVPVEGEKHNSANEVLKAIAPVVTLECYQETADVAQKIFDSCEDHVTINLGKAMHGSMKKKSSASSVFTVQLNVGAAIDLRVGKAADEMRKLSKQIEKGQIPPFDIIFLDADKETYGEYYTIAMEGYGDNFADGRITKMLSSNGVILADNSMCAILYDQSDFRSQKLHEFNQLVKNDDRVDQVVMTIREGITMIKPKSLDNYIGPKEGIITMTKP